MSPHLGDDPQSRLAYGRFCEWFVYERSSRSHREPPIETFLGRLPQGERRRFVESLRENVLDTFAVRAAAPKLGLTLESLATGRMFDVVERSASQALSPGAVLIGRIFPLGSDTRPYDASCS